MAQGKRPVQVPTKMVTDDVDHDDDDDDYDDDDNDDDDDRLFVFFLLFACIRRSD